MKLILSIAVAIAGLGYCSQPNADCYVRSAVHLTRTSQPVDWQKLVTPDSRGQKCLVQYRVLLNNKWETAEGEAVGSNESEACARALDIGRGYLLAEVTPDRVAADSQMVCSDLPEITVHPVHIGDIIWQSEVDVHTIPAERKDFWYKRSRCRMFVERDAKNSNLWLYQGEICQISTQPNSKWQVIDKY
jgi:hypothetical protein